MSCVFLFTFLVEIQAKKLKINKLKILFRYTVCLSFLSHCFCMLCSCILSVLLHENLACIMFQVNNASIYIFYILCFLQWTVGLKKKKRKKNCLVSFFRVFLNILIFFWVWMGLTVYFILCFLSFDIDFFCYSYWLNYFNWNLYFLKLWYNLQCIC